MSVQRHNHNFVAIASAAIFAAGGSALAQNVPSQSNPSAYTTSPQAAGVEPVSSPPAQLPIGLVAQRTGGSLLRAESFAKTEGGPMTTSSASYYDVPEPKPKLLRKHDLVTIVIRENSQFASNDTTDLKHSNDLDAIIDSYFMLGVQGGGPSLIEHAPTTPIEMKTSGQRDFKGTAALERDDTFTGRITAEVIDVKPNGTLILQATEEIKTDEEEQRVTLIGTCRVDDLTPDNTVLSNQIYNLHLNKQHKGAVKDTGTRGIFTRLLDWINPF
ncbi:MAG: flagellar basal body L-ring protein FlgH [Tepidisphaeraceae bacterium]|jgi:flagellar L-ring protein precursor FlgH